MDITHLLEKSMQDHDHLFPRQILGVRIGLAGMKALGFDEPPTNKQLLVISETDGCFVDGVSAASGCTVGHRSCAWKTTVKLLQHLWTQEPVALFVSRRE